MSKGDNYYHKFSFHAIFFTLNRMILSHVSVFVIFYDNFEFL